MSISYKNYLAPVVVLLAVIALAVLGTQWHPFVKKTPHSPTVASMPDIYGMWVLTNQQREKAGLKPYVLDLNLNKSASDKCNDMVVNHYWGHIDANGKHGYEYIKQYEQYVSADENLAKDATTNEMVINGFMNSPPHRAGELSTAYTNVGYAVCNDGPDVYVVQHFSQL